MDREQALQLAKSKSLDLLLIADMGEPPVAKIIDYGKYLFDAKKKKSASQKKQHQTQLKEIKIRPGTEESDYQVKIRNLTRFLNDGDKTKVTLRFRGREMAHTELGRKMLERIKLDLDEHGDVEQMPELEGRQMIMILSPKRKN